MNCRKGFCFYFSVMSILIAAFPVKAKAQKDEAAIRTLLTKQTQGWNQGNMEEFMNGYWKSDSLLFIGKSGPKYGYKTTLENYKKNYPDTASMGKLHFKLLNIKRLSPVYYFVSGNWKLQRSKGDLEGYFTLLIKKIRDQWLIICDHSS